MPAPSSRRRAPASTPEPPMRRRSPTSSPRRSWTSSACPISSPAGGPECSAAGARPADGSIGTRTIESVTRPYRIVFVCLGNICRSPMAELAMRRLIDEEGLGDRILVRSAGTGDYHVGEPADPRAVQVLREHGYQPDGHRAAQFLAGDF